jgi:transposase-like protein
MDLSRTTYSRDLKMAAMRAIDSGSTVGEIARKNGDNAPNFVSHSRGSLQSINRTPPRFPQIVTPSMRKT